MTRLSSTGLLAIALVAFSAASASARSSQGDAAATRTYLKAHYTEVRANGIAYQAGIKAVGALAAKVQAECPGILAAAPHPAVQSRSEVEISEEVFAAVLHTPERAQHAAIARFAHSVRHLHWSSRKLTRLVHTDAAKRAAQSAVQPPNLCTDLRAWAASGYQTPAAGTKSYLRRLSVLGLTGLHLGSAGTTEKTIARMLSRYENRADRAIVRRTTKLAAQQQATVGNSFVVAAAKVTQALHGT
jgi:hypothetical protein